MAQLSVLIVTEDSEFRSAVTQIVRSSGVPIGILAEALSDASERSVDVALVDVRAPDAGWTDYRGRPSALGLCVDRRGGVRLRARPYSPGDEGRGERVLCLAEVGLFLGVRPRFTVLDALDSVDRLDTVFLKKLVATHKTGLDIMAGSEQLDRPNPQDTSRVEELLPARQQLSLRCDRRRWTAECVLGVRNFFV